MTRLTAGNLSNLSDSLKHYDQTLVKVTGCTLKQLACKAAGVTEKTLLTASQEIPVAVIPVTAGQGVITGFSTSVQAIANHLGFQADITETADVAGLYEAIIKQYGIIMLADDNRFITINFQTLHVAENNHCTALGYVTALDLMSNGLIGRNILVIGCGELGSNIIKLLTALKANIAAYDPDSGRSKKLAHDIFKIYGKQVRIEKSLVDSLSKHNLLVDASPAAAIIDAGFITDETFLAAPGIPQGATAAARKKLANRYLHDPLQIGTAVMLVSAATISSSSSAF